jgi:hypothetical protein
MSTLNDNLTTYNTTYYLSNLITSSLNPSSTSDQTTSTNIITTAKTNIFTETKAIFNHLSNITTTKLTRRNDWSDYDSIDLIPDIIWESLLSMLLFLILLIVLCFICWKTQFLQGKYMGYTITRSEVENL